MPRATSSGGSQFNCSSPSSPALGQSELSEFLRADYFNCSDPGMIDFGRGKEIKGQDLPFEALWHIVLNFDQTNFLVAGKPVHGCNVLVVLQVLGGQFLRLFFDALFSHDRLHDLYRHIITWLQMICLIGY